LCLLCSPQKFLENELETIALNIDATGTLLDIAKDKKQSFFSLVPVQFMVIRHPQRYRQKKITPVILYRLTAELPMQNRKEWRDFVLCVSAEFRGRY